MKKLLVFILVIAGIGYWFKSLVQSGAVERYLDAHPNPALNPQVEYYWGVLLDLANHSQSAMYRYHRVVDKYPRSSSAPLAWVASIELLDDSRKALAESERFLAAYPDHPKAELVRRKISIIKNGY